MRMDSQTLTSDERQSVGSRKEVNPMRSRSFGGCAPCRRRRLKCDESRPSCCNCSTAELDCSYEKSIFFGSGDDVDLGEHRYRRPILSEIQQRLMSECLTFSINPNSALRHISRIEEACESADPDVDIQISRGPFGAFRLIEGEQAPPDEHAESFQTSSRALDVAGIDNGMVLASVNLGISNILDMESSMNDALNYCEMFIPDSYSGTWCDYFGEGRIYDIPDDPSMRPSNPNTFCLAEQTLSTLCDQPNTARQFPLSSYSQNEIIQDAVPLLKHYQSTILPLLTPFRHSKTPWHVLFVPQVKTCLAALTLGEEVDSAVLCAFYGTLSISALSLGGVSRSSRWAGLSKTYRKLARGHMKEVLASAYDIPKKAKYKSILIALLSMVQLSIVCGNERQIENYLKEAERFIRLRGLQRRKSRKVRLLHHCYAFERIFFESTSFHEARQDYCLGNDTSPMNENAVSFRLSYWTNLEQAMLREKSREEGENDLHLELPGEWSATLYPEIFGVPEQWILLVSLVIQLAREKCNSRQLPSHSRLGLKDFLDRAKAIERMINRLQRPTADPDLNNLLEAMQHALAIYFYRRIYDVEASVLQHKVAAIRKCLLQVDDAQLPAAYGAARFIWPAIIAAREAENLEDQLCFSNWFHSCAQKAGLHLFSKALESIQAVWEAKRPASMSCSTSTHIMDGGLSLEGNV